MGRNVVNMMLTLFVAVVLGLAGCGGGSAHDNVLADAGQTQHVLTGKSVTLDGSHSAGSDGYQWSMVAKPAGSAARLDNPSSVNPTFTPDVPGTYSFNLLTTKGNGSSDMASVSVVASVAMVSIQSSATGTFVLKGTGLESVAGIDVSATYDSTTLANPRVTMGTLTSGMLNGVNRSNPLRIAMVSTKGIGGSGSGDLATIVFDTIGTSPGKITALSGTLIDSYGKPVNSQFVVAPAL